MKRKRKRYRWAAQQGFTLLELLLVLALLVVVGAIASPSLTKPLAAQRLRKSGEQIRVVWARARVQAMKTGRIYAFQCQLDGNAFRLEPWATADDFIDANSGGQTETAIRASELVSGGGDLVEDETLADDVSFFNLETTENIRSQYAAAMAQLDGSVDAEWSSPVLFYPDGSSSDARLVLANTRERYVAIHLRGLTGISRTSHVSTNSEVVP